MKNKLTIIFFFFNYFIYSQNLTLDNLLTFSKNNPVFTNEYLLKKGWRLHSSKKDTISTALGTIMSSEKVSWGYNSLSDEKLNCWLDYKIEINNDLKYFSQYDYTFLEIKFYNKLTADIKLKGWKLIQNEILPDAIVKTYKKGNISLAVINGTREGKQYYKILLGNSNPTYLY